MSLPIGLRLLPPANTSSAVRRNKRLAILAGAKGERLLLGATKDVPRGLNSRDACKPPLWPPTMPLRRRPLPLAPGALPPSVPPPIAAGKTMPRRLLRSCTRRPSAPGPALDVRNVSQCGECSSRLSAIKDAEVLAIPPGVDRRWPDLSPSNEILRYPPLLRPRDTPRIPPGFADGTLRIRL